ncbi:DNA mismatch repair protein MutS [bacterium 3DAC]|nr:DNA mismatch repair protein MutS [Dictyoglomota bacterium]UZN23064.1 DNA mismatch repair protein MutS [bacterium 3DAC]
MSTPMARQYWKLKNMVGDDILLAFRLGDFYEFFFEDAYKVSDALGIVLTSREFGKGNRVPMAGIPHHALDSRLKTLIDRGYKVAICEQVEDPKKAKGLVQRDIVKIYTPGTYADDEQIEHTWLLSIEDRGNDIAYYLIDATTLDFISFVLPVSIPLQDIVGYIMPYQPKEILISSKEVGLPLVSALANHLKATVTRWDEGDNALERARSYIAYVNRTEKEEIVFENKEDIDYMMVDSSAIKALELVINSRDGGRSGTLLEVLDKTQTPMGRRSLFHRILRPYTNLEKINKSLDRIEKFINEPILLENIHSNLKGIKDLKRISKKLSTGSIKLSDLQVLRVSLEKVVDINSLLENSPLVGEWSMEKAQTVLEFIARYLPDEPSEDVKGGFIIADGVDEEVDKLRDFIKEANKWLVAYESRLRDETGIHKLRIKYNDAFGYYIEVPRAQAKKMKIEGFIRKQTLVNYERFTNEKLAQFETKIKEVWQRLEERQKQIYSEFLEKLKEMSHDIDTIAEEIASLDVTVSLALVALHGGWVRPRLGNKDHILIRDGRHPVVEYFIGRENFIPNDTYLTKTRPLALLTGPNMAGKSTYLRQVGIIVLLAHMGSFVPAKDASIPIITKMFARVGATDDIAFGKSTFMVEMSEVAKILKEADGSSLVLLDEIGRGTSTYDGISVAWATIEELISRGENTPFTIMSTHYLELADFARDNERIQLLKVDVIERDGEVVFLHKVVSGVSDNSYGLEVARLAGIPEHVIRNAEKVFNKLLERTETSETENKVPKRKVVQIKPLPLFGDESDG